jgi:GPN-loop GTPase
MLNLTKAIDRATGYVFIPPADVKAPEGTVDTSDIAGSLRPNTYSLFSSALGSIPGVRGDVRDVQERWIDAKEEWDAYERAQWRQEGQKVQDELARLGKVKQGESAEQDARAS